VKKHQRSPLAAAILMALATNAYADTNTKDAGYTFSLDKVTVAATLTEQKIEDVANTVSVIGADQIEKQNPSDVRELLKYEPGIDVATEGRFGLNSINVRGSDENKVKIVIDGIDQSKAYNASSRFQQSGRFALDMDTLKQAEVVKGPASSIYGSNAIGGVVAFTTKDPSDYLAAEGDDTAASIKTSYHSIDDETSISATIANRTDRLESLLVYTVRDGEETENMGDVGGTGSDRTKPNPLDKESTNILAKLQYQINDAHRIGLTVEDYSSESESEVLNNLSSVYSLYDGADEADRSRYSIEHNWEANNAAFDKASTTLSYQKTENHSVTDNVITSGYGPAYGFPVGFPFAVVNEGRTKDYSYEEEQLQLNSTFAKQVDNHTITYGINIKETEFVSVANTLFDNFDDDIARWSPLTEELAYGVFIQDQISLLDGQLTLSPSIRYDHYDIESKTDSVFTTELEDKTHSKASFRLGSVYQLTDNLSVFAQYAQGFKTPDLEDMYQEFVNTTHGYAIIGNPDLKPEESDSYEVGLRFSNDLGDIEVTAFYNDYDNYIDEVSYAGSDSYAGLTVNQDQNIAEANIKGLEVRGSIWLDETIGAPTGTRLHMSAAYIEGEGKNDGDTSDSPLSGIAPLKGVFGLTYDAPSSIWGGALDWTLVQHKRENETPDGEFAPHGFGLVDLSAYYNVTDQLVVRANINNLTDKKHFLYEDVRGYGADDTDLDRYSQPGRNFNISATYSF
jgi:hemoglobin/transferrin/lactoferrin receptor protein